MPNELKPCPFCGSRATVSYNTYFGFIPWCTMPLCILNELCAGHETEEAAVAAWNRRVNDEQTD